MASGAGTMSSWDPVASPRHTPLLSPRKRWLFSLLPIALVLLLAEMGSRVWLYRFAPREVYSLYAVPSEFPEAAKYAPHHYLCYRLQPGYSSGGTTHNSFGFRGPEIAMPKPSGLFRVAVLGGSTTYGEFIDNDADTFPAQLERELKEQLGRGNIEVINAGVPGYSSWESLGNLAYFVLDLEPDLVIPYEGVNDVHARLVLPSAFRGDNSGRRRIWTEPGEVTLCKHSVLARVVGYHLGLWRLPGVDSFVQAPTSDPGTHGPSRALGGEPMNVLDQTSPRFTTRNVQSMVGMGQAHGAKVMLATWGYSPHKGDYTATAHYTRGFAEQNRAIRALGERLNVTCFDFAAVMPTSPEYWRDGRHVNAKGAKLQAELFANFIVKQGLLDD